MTISFTHLSLFTGIGGLDLAAEMAGYTTVGQCEFADYPYKVLCKHWPDVPKWRDIRELTGSDFYGRTGLRTVDVLSGGFPCQPFSIAGRRRGKDDDRYLWPEMLRVIKEIRPAWIVCENVAGLVSMAEFICKPKVESRTISRNANEDYYGAVYTQQEHMLLNGILKDIETAGYTVQPFIIPACGVGAPHKRERLFIVANADGERKQQPGRNQSKVWERSCNGSKNVGYPDSSGCRGDYGRRQSPQPKNRCENVSDTNGTRLQGRAETGNFDCSKQKRTQLIAGCNSSAKQWSAEPEVGRVANGVPSRVDRLKCLGNAVVWQQAFPIFETIYKIEKINY